MWSLSQIILGYTWTRWSGRRRGASAPAKCGSLGRGDSGGGSRSIATPVLGTIARQLTVGANTGRYTIVRQQQPAVRTVGRSCPALCDGPDLGARICAGAMRLAESAALPLMASTQSSMNCDGSWRPSPCISLMRAQTSSQVESRRMRAVIASLRRLGAGHRAAVATPSGRWRGQLGRLDSRQVRVVGVARSSRSSGQRRFCACCPDVLVG